MNPVIYMYYRQTLGGTGSITPILPSPTWFAWLDSGIWCNVLCFGKKLNFKTQAADLGLCFPLQTGRGVVLHYNRPVFRCFCVGFWIHDKEIHFVGKGVFIYST